MTLRLVTATPADAALAALHAVDLAVERADASDMPVPPPASHLAFHRHPPPTEEAVYALAQVRGETVGYVNLVFPQRDNRHLTDIADLAVHPEHRRRGIGRALFEHAVAESRRRGRSHLVAATVTALPGGPARSRAGEHFARALGASAALSEVRRRLDLTGPLPDWAAQRRRAEAHAAGYSLVYWREAAPDELLDDLARLDGRMISDSPTGDLALEPMAMDAARIRATDQRHRDQRRRAYNVGARHDASGRLAAWTRILCYDNDRGHAWQLVTIVGPEHRGHRLGALVKLANLAHVRSHEPRVQVVDTFNADSNDYMIAINEQLGFRPLDGWIDWQLVLPAATGLTPAGPGAPAMVTPAAGAA